MLNKLEEFLELLKINEIYDNSFIFVTSDHAFRLNDKKKLIKGQYNSQDFEGSSKKLR